MTTRPVNLATLSPAAAVTLGEFCAGLTLSAVPQDVLQVARACLIDTAAVAAFGSRFDWSQAVARYAMAYGRGGPCKLMGMAGVRVHAPCAALANGAFAHAFEQDSLRKPGAGVHPGAALFAPALALAEERQATGERFLLAFVAACEAMFRIGNATLHSSERLGFHAPGLTGPYGAAIAAGVIMGLGPAQLTSALGIAGSLSSGLLAFSAATQGAEVKRLHLGRACESGVLAARLAEEGFCGPETILEGRFGLLQTYCAQSDAALLTQELGTTWETRRICLKAYPCHVTAHTPIESLRGLMAEAGFGPQDVAHMTLHVSHKVLSHHDIRTPHDILQGQYSVPFCVALALHADPADPSVFNQGAVADPEILQTCADIRLVAFEEGAPRSAWASRLQVRLKDGRVFEREADQFAGSPEQPLSRQQLEQRFNRLTNDYDTHARSTWFNSLSQVEDVANMSTLPDLAPAA